MRSATVSSLGTSPLVDELDLPDPNDKHLPAATIRTSAQVIFTSKLKDFRQQSLAAMIELMAS